MSASSTLYSNNYKNIKLPKETLVIFKLLKRTVFAHHGNKKPKNVNLRDQSETGSSDIFAFDLHKSVVYINMNLL